MIKTRIITLNIFIEIPLIKMNKYFGLHFLDKCRKSKITCHVRISGLDCENSFNSFHIKLKYFTHLQNGNKTGLKIQKIA